MDGSDNIYVADIGSGTANAYSLNVSTAPTLTFATTTNAGTTDATDGAKTVTITNDGNATLTIPSATNPVVGADFTYVTGGSACATSLTSLIADASCNIGVMFTPLLATGTNPSISETAVLTDNNLNVTSNTQTITLHAALPSARAPPRPWSPSARRRTPSAQRRPRSTPPSPIRRAQARRRPATLHLPDRLRRDCHGDLPRRHHFSSALLRELHHLCAHARGSGLHHHRISRGRQQLQHRLQYRPVHHQQGDTHLRHHGLHSRHRLVAGRHQPGHHHQRHPQLRRSHSAHRCGHLHAEQRRLRGHLHRQRHSAHLHHHNRRSGRHHRRSARGCLHGDGEPRD